MYTSTPEQIQMDLYQANEPEVADSLLRPNKEEKKRNSIQNIWWKFKLPIILFIVFALTFLTITISLILYSKVYVDEDERLDEYQSNRSTYMFMGSLTIKDSCKLEPWIRNESALQKRITEAYRLSPALQSYFISAEVKYLLPEHNTSAFLRLNFSMPSTNTIEMKYKMSEEFVGAVLRQNIYDQEKSMCTLSTVLLDSFHSLLTY
ncbi:TPA-induced transmembrane protein [Rhinophrynus dorsalis]